VSHAAPLPPPRYSRSLNRLVAVTLGLLLLAAAALKLRGLGVDAVGRLGIFSAAEFQLAVVEFEVFLAAWLLCGKRPLGAWLLAVATFSGFAVISLFQGWVGQTSCGCFGRLSVSPWYALGLDVAVLAALLVGRPDLKPLWDKPRSTAATALAPLACGVAGILVISGLLVGLAAANFGSVRAAVAHFRGDRVAVQPAMIDVGKGESGESREVDVEVSNWTDSPVRLIGGTADCSCTVLNDLPVTIPAKETRPVKVRLRMSGTPGRFTRSAGFLVDDEGLKRLNFRLTGRISGLASAGR
jgi:hypothetical protein